MQLSFNSTMAQHQLPHESILPLQEQDVTNQSESSHEDACQENTQPKEDDLFEKKLFRKLSKKPIDHPMHEWIALFANKLAYHAQTTRECGIALANKLLDFPQESKIAQAVRNHLLELFESKDFLEKATFVDELAQNRADELLKKFTFAVEAITKSYRLVPLMEIPKHLIVNEEFISDPRIMLYNIFLKTGGLQLPAEDHTLEMRVALICANLRDQLFQKLIPHDIKNPFEQEAYLKRKISDVLGLEVTSLEYTVDEKNIHLAYKRMKVPLIKSCIIKGSETKYYYTSSKGEKKLYNPPIPKGQGYANPQLLVDHLLAALNSFPTLGFESFDHACIKERMQMHDEAERSAKVDEYIERETGKLTPEGAIGLLYSLGYLKNGAPLKENDQIKC